MKNNFFSFGYKGIVTISTIINGKKITLQTHNAGTKYISQLFTSSVLGYNTQNLYPKFLDVGYFWQKKRTESQQEFDYSRLDINNFISMRYNSIGQGITGKTYEIDNDTGWWQPSLDAVLLRNSFVRSSRTETDESSTTFFSPICLCLKNLEGNILAYVVTKNRYLEKHGDDDGLFGDSTNLLVQWVMQLVNIGDVQQELEDLSDTPEPIQQQSSEQQNEQEQEPEENEG